MPSHSQPGVAQSQRHERPSQGDVVVNINGVTQDQLNQMEARIMAKIDDLRNLLNGMNDKVTEVANEVGVVATEVTSLNEKLKNLPVDIPQELLDQTSAMATRLTDAAAALKAIPTPDDVPPVV